MYLLGKGRGRSKICAYFLGYLSHKKGIKYSRDIAARAKNLVNKFY